LYLYQYSQSSLSHSELTEKASKAQLHINHVIYSTNNGWDVLKYLVQQVVPCLGRLDLDVNKLTSGFTATHGMQTPEFIIKAQKIDQTFSLITGQDHYQP